MKLIGLKEASEGDVLGRDLLSDAGTLVLPKGTELKASVLVRLSRMGIQEVAIEDSDRGNKNSDRARLLELLRRRFNGTDSNPWLVELKRIAADHIGGMGGVGGGE